MNRGAIAFACLGALLPLLGFALLLGPRFSREPALRQPSPTLRPRIALVIDDAGVDVERSARAIRLQAGVTLAFLPYAPLVTEQIDAARRAGHEVLAHVPMEPLSSRHDPGPYSLRVGASPAELRRRIDASLRLVPSVVGINNHMGSRFTGDRDGMDVLFTELAQRGLLFLDSRTIDHTVARESAIRHGVPYVERDVFLDHDENAVAVARQIALVERQARQHGLAVAIGHPLDVTLAAIEPWLAQVEQRGFELVPVSSVVRRPAAAVGAPAASARRP